MQVRMGWRSGPEPIGAEVLKHREGSKSHFFFFPLFLPPELRRIREKAFSLASCYGQAFLWVLLKRHAVFLDLA